MAENIGLTEAAQALNDHFGPTLVAGRDEGRRLMCDALVDELGVSEAEAKRLVGALEAANSIRYREGFISAAPVPPYAAPEGGRIIPADQMGMGSPSAFSEGGTWQLTPGGA